MEKKVKRHKHMPDDTIADYCENCGHGQTWCKNCEEVTYSTQDYGQTWEKNG